MIPTQGYWGGVGVDSYIKDATGTTWRICAVDTTVAHQGVTTGAFRCRNRAGEWVTIAPKPVGEPVTVMMAEDAADESEALIGLLRDRLGAEVLATQDHATKVWTCERWPETYKGALAKWRTHLNITHGMYVDDVKTYVKLVEAHAAAHDEDLPHVGKHLPHTHA